ncbi:MAG: winged helix-turn-helix domain-containing protein, partial [Desulfobacterales bacterium]|nr:winged helix-turn-helix domain-containing protein [Desulfobacterales bacterium]
EIIEIIKSDNKISYRAIAKKLDINDSAVDKHIKSLKEKGILKRVGGTRGHWEVKE